MQKITVKPKKIKQKIPLFDDEIRFNMARRLRNALLALAYLDPGWMYWVERNIPKTMNMLPKTRQIERQARLKLAGYYKFLGSGAQSAMIYSDFYFKDNGDLKTYL
jgi:hypothetical protein